MTNFTDIRDFLRAHCARYPELALQDVFKALYQSAFGCEHLIADPSAAADYIRAEAARSGDRISELVELLSGDYCRVHLGILQDGCSFCLIFFAVFQNISVLTVQRRTNS